MHNKIKFGRLSHFVLGVCNRKKPAPFNFLKKILKQKLQIGGAKKLVAFLFNKKLFKFKFFTLRKPICNMAIKLSKYLFLSLSFYPYVCPPVCLCLSLSLSLPLSHITSCCAAQILTIICNPKFKAPSLKLNLLWTTLAEKHK